MAWRLLRREVPEISAAVASLTLRRAPETGLIQYSWTNCALPRAAMTA
jgi:hypothetical protein